MNDKEKSLEIVNKRLDGKTKDLLINQIELLDIYDNEGNVTGKTVVRGDKTIVLNDNEHIAVAIIFIENSKGEYLIQKTSQEKGELFSSAGGHVDSGETPLDAIKREVKEELGIDIYDDHIEEYGFFIFDKRCRTWNERLFRYS